MKTMQRVLRVAACGLCAATALPAVAAETQPGFYLGLGAGQSSYDMEKTEFDVIVLDVLFSQGAFPTSLTSTFEDSDTTVSLVAGYNFNSYIAVEAGYVDLGTAEYRSSGTVNPPGPVASAPTTLNLDVESKGFTAAALGSLPLGEVVNLHGRLGFLVASTELSVTARIGNGVGTDSDKLDSVSAFFSVGAGVNLGDHWSLSLDWTRYNNIGDENDDDDLSTEAGFDVDALSVSALFRF